MSASAGCQLLGEWRIIEADTWDCDYLDLVQPAYIVFGKNGRGEFAFGAIEATLELEYATPSSKSNYPSTMETMPS